MTAARHIQEDICLLEIRDDEWVLTGGAVCFPTGWNLDEKIGSPLREIHAPIPGIEDLSVIIDRFLDRMDSGSMVSRSTWSLVADESLRLEPLSPQACVELPNDPGEDIYLRVERQTLHKLEGGDAICFTIRVHRWPLGAIVNRLPAESMLSTLTDIPIDIAACKNIEDIKAGVIEWLRRNR